MKTGSTSAFLNAARASTDKSGSPSEYPSKGCTFASTASNTPIGAARTADIGKLDEGICQSGGERLCTEAEWTFACEGDDAAPYPYGYERDAQACVVDRIPLLQRRSIFHERKLAHARPLTAAAASTPGGGAERA